MKRQQDVSAKSGDTIRLEITVKDGAAAKNLTGCSAAWRMAASYAGPALVSKTTAAGISITDAPAGKLIVTLEPADTADLKGDFVHELEIVDGSGAKATALDGRFRLLEDLVA